MGVIMGNLMRKDRAQLGLSIEQAARRLNLTPNRYQDVEAGAIWPDWETFDRMCKVFGWHQTYVGLQRVEPHGR